MRSAKGLLVALSVLAATPAFAASPVLLGAPVADPFDSWVTQNGVPPTGPVNEIADEFLLSNDTFVSQISMLVYGFDGAPAFYGFALVDDLTDTTPLYSFVANAPSNANVSVDLEINAVLPAGIYYLRLETTGFMGWVGSDGNFVTTAGAVADGVWMTGAQGDWAFVGPNAFGRNAPGVFAVFGADDGSGGGGAPEPAAWALLVGGFGLLGAAMRRSRAAGATS